MPNRKPKHIDDADASATQERPAPLSSARFLRALDGYREVWVITHDFPDPDAITSGWALRFLIEQQLSVPCRLVGGGDIVRAENRELVRLLSPPIELVSELSPTPDTATVLVDSSPNARNHLLSRISALPHANIDHHRGGGGGERIAFSDVRPDVAATVSIAASYLREQDIEPSQALATGMLYAMRTETLGYETRFSRLDREIMPWLAERADLSKVAEIENAPLPRSYFGDLALALQNAFLYDDAALCILPRAEGPETVAEVADLLVRAERVQRVLCAALVGRDVMISVRTGPGAGDAGVLARKVLTGIGNAGGHEHRAGGKISDVGDVTQISSELRADLRRRFLHACDIEQERGTRLVPRKEIVSNL